MSQPYIPLEFNMLVICQGPPRCSLMMGEAVEAIKAGCPWCRRERYYEDGTMDVTEPGRA